MIDYELIGKNIRRYRRIAGLSQEQLAEAVDISVTHMSHIETASTKLSLQVFVDIAETLHITTDALLWDDNKHFSSDENIYPGFTGSDSNPIENLIIRETVDSLHNSLTRYVFR